MINNTVKLMMSCKIAKYIHIQQYKENGLNDANASQHINEGYTSL